MKKSNFIALILGTVGGALGLTGVAAVAAKGVLSIFGGNPGQWIQDSMAAGVKFLNKLMGISQL